MAKRIILIVLLLVLALLGYAGYHTYDAKRAEMNGAVYSNGVIRRVQPPPKNRAPDAENIVYPPDPSTATTATPQDQESAQPEQADAQPATLTAPTEESPQVMQNQQMAGNVPATDSITPNPPNGMTFAGSGRFQLYRQGNITWRLDTESGRTCIIFATDEEWRKPKVYRAGCGKN